MAALAFELLHISGEIIFEKLEPVPDVATNLLWKFAQLLSCFLGDEQFVSHWARRTFIVPALFYPQTS